jgi:predicted helicase
MPFKEYLAEIQRNLKGGQSTEPSYYPALKALLESLDPSITAVTNPKKTAHGSPDLSIRRKRRILEFPVGWIEAKEIGEDLDKIEKTDQIKRYLNLSNLVLTDFLEFRWYADGERRLVARLASVHGKKVTVEQGGETGVQDLLKGFLQHQIPPVRGSRELARRMANLAHFIHDAILVAFERESDRGRLHRQLEAFQNALIPDLKPEQFSDMYAQTIAYGLFAARCQSPQANGGFTRASAAELIPKTNPFLRKLFQVIAGVDLPETIRPFVDDLVASLRGTDVGSVLADFGKRAAKEDSVVHFYEDFLQEYDPKLRELRGVYYTPEPVVSFIVRSIDHLLKTEFAKPLGLADKDVLILDPACGTGTFLYFVIRQIYQALIEKGQKGQWNSYVSENLLKRVFGFELLMAPYAVAHLKLGLLLQELGYRFDADERLGIYLTNSLEEAVKRSQQVFAFADAITDEGIAAQKIKRDQKIMVVLGNPPYSGHSANRSYVDRTVEPGEAYTVVVGGPLPEQQSVQRRIAKRRMNIREKTFIGSLIQDYFKVDGKPLGEKNPKWLQDDYVKFIRFGQWRIERTGYGILAFITNHGYLDNPTFRGMRQQLMRTFSEISVLDLHGSSKKKESAPDGSKDENVFDIQQGVGIGVFVKKPGAAGPAQVRHGDLWGDRESKYKNLFKMDCDSTRWEKLEPSSPNYLFVPQSTDLLAEYEKGWKVTEICPLNAIGLNSHRDDFAIAFEQAVLQERIDDLISDRLEDDDLRLKYGLKDTADFNFARTRQTLRQMKRPHDLIVPCIYRPFDYRFVLYHPEILDRPRPELNSHFIGHQNIGLVTTRQTREPFAALVVDRACGQHKIVARYDGSSVFPLYLYPSQDRIRFAIEGKAANNQEIRHANLSTEFVGEAEAKLGLKCSPEGHGDLVRTFGPEDALNYIYAMLYSFAFRQRYSEFLRADFPHVPLTSDKHLFSALASKGADLVSLHLMESPSLSQFITRYEQKGGHLVEKVRYAEANPAAKIPSGRVYINAAQFFEGVPKQVWEFQIGGYQVCDKWLKDRKGRALSSDEIDHYQKVVVALNETIRIMREIDAVIPGWPLP